MKANSLKDKTPKPYLGTRLRKNWLNRNVDLEKLTEQIGDFFKTKQFEAIKGETNSGYQIFAQDSLDYKFSGYVTVAIEGRPQEFLIELEHPGKSKRDIYFPIMSTALLGGGYFLSRSLKAREEWLRFERDFWDFIDKVIDYLSNTSN